VRWAGTWSCLPLQTLAGVGGFARAQWDEVRHVEEKGDGSPEVYEPALFLVGAFRRPWLVTFDGA
jgi:hypothetical protein